MFTIKFSLFGTAVWPARGNIYVNVLFFIYIDNNNLGIPTETLRILVGQDRENSSSIHDVAYHVSIIRNILFFSERRWGTFLNIYFPYVHG